MSLIQVGVRGWDHCGRREQQGEVAQLTLWALFLFPSNSPLLSASSTLEHPPPDSCPSVSVPPPPRSPPAPGPVDAPTVSVLTLCVLPFIRLG